MFFSVFFFQSIAEIFDPISLIMDTAFFSNHETSNEAPHIMLVEKEEVDPNVDLEEEDLPMSSTTTTAPATNGKTILLVDPSKAKGKE